MYRIDVFQNFELKRDLLVFRYTKQYNYYITVIIIKQPTCDVDMRERERERESNG